MKRQTLLAALRDAGMKPHVPDGAYYILAEAHNLPRHTAAEKARTLLHSLQQHLDLKRQNAISFPGSMTRATYSVRTVCPSCKSRLPLERIAYTPSFPCPRCEAAIRVSPIFSYNHVAISIVGGILLPFLLGARDFDWLMSSYALALFLTLLLAGLQPYTAKYLVAPRLAWCNELTSLGVTRALHRKAERDAALERHKAFLRASETPIILDLAHRGIRVESVWDLPKTPAFYDEAVPVLLEHLRRPYPAEIVQAMIHALTAHLRRPYYNDILARIAQALTARAQTSRTSRS